MGDDFRTSFMCLDNAWATKAAIHDAAGIKDPWNASDVSVPCWALQGRPCQVPDWTSYIFVILILSLSLYLFNHYNWWYYAQYTFDWCPTDVCPVIICPYNITNRKDILGCYRILQSLAGFFWLSSWASCEGPWFAPGGVWKLGPGWQLRIWKVWSTERHTLLKISDGFLGCSWKFHDCLLIPLRNWTWIFCLLLGMQITSIVQAQAGRGNSRGQLAPSWRGAISPWKVKTSPHACVWKWGYPPKHYAWGV